MSILNEYQQQGFYLAKGLFDKTEINEVIKNLLQTFNNQLQAIHEKPHENIFDAMTLLYKSDTERYKKTIASLWRKISIYNLLHHEKIQNFVKTHFHFKDIVIPGGQVFLIMSEQLKIPDGYFGFAAHQDYPSVQGSLDGLVIWVPLVDIDKNNYPLEIIPQSHTQGILTPENEDTNWTIKPELYDENAFIPLECEQGDVVFMSYFSIHRSSTSGDGRIRLACSTRYDNAEEPSFIKRIYPSAYIRNVSRRLMTHDP